MDITSDKEVKEAIKDMNKKAKELNGRGIDILVNNAGIGFFGSAEELSMENWQKTFDTNFFGALRVIKAILPFMKERKEGQIINTNSLGGMVAIPFQSHYSASKAALKVFTEGLRVELREFNIKVSSLLPSDVNTNFNKNTGKLANGKFKKLDSVDLKEMIDNIPVDNKSSYLEKSQKVWGVIIKNLIIAPPPTAVSKKLARILKKKNPKINYVAGDFVQGILLFIIRRLVTDRFTYFLLPKYYGM